MCGHAWGIGMSINISRWISAMSCWLFVAGWVGVPPGAGCCSVSIGMAIPTAAEDDGTNGNCWWSSGWVSSGGGPRCSCDWPLVDMVTRDSSPTFALTLVPPPVAIKCIKPLESIGLDSCWLWSSVGLKNPTKSTTVGVALDNGKSFYHGQSWFVESCCGSCCCWGFDDVDGTSSMEERWCVGEFGSAINMFRRCSSWFYHIDEGFDSYETMASCQVQRMKNKSEPIFLDLLITISQYSRDFFSRLFLYRACVFYFFSFFLFFFFFFSSHDDFSKNSEHKNREKDRHRRLLLFLSRRIFFSLRC